MKVDEIKRLDPIGDSLGIYDNRWEQLKDVILAAVKSDRFTLLDVKAFNLLSEEGRKKIGVQNSALPVRRIASSGNLKTYVRITLILPDSDLEHYIKEAVKEDLKENPSEYVLNKSDLRLASTGSSKILKFIAEKIWSDVSVQKKIVEAQEGDDLGVYIVGGTRKKIVIENPAPLLKDFIKSTLIPRAGEIFASLFRTMPPPVQRDSNHEKVLGEILTKIDDLMGDYISNMMESGKGGRGLNPSLAGERFNRLTERLSLPRDVKEEWVGKLKELVGNRKSQLSRVLSRNDAISDRTLNSVSKQLTRAFPSLLKSILEDAARTDRSLTMNSLGRELLKGLVDEYNGPQDDKYVKAVARKVLDKNNYYVERELLQYLETDAYDSGEAEEIDEDDLYQTRGLTEEQIRLIQDMEKKNLLVGDPPPSPARWDNRNYNFSVGDRVTLTRFSNLIGGMRGVGKEEREELKEAFSDFYRDLRSRSLDNDRVISETIGFFEEEVEAGLLTPDQIQRAILGTS